MAIAWCTGPGLGASPWAHLRQKIGRLFKGLTLDSKSKDEVSRRTAIAICVASVLACLGYAWLRSDLPEWWRDHGGGIPYVVFWICFGFAIVPQRRWIVQICATAVAVTCLLEVLQLWQPLWLTAFRSTRFGAALLGSQFTWHDFPPYFIGGIIGCGVLFFQPRQQSTEHK